MFVACPAQCNAKDSIVPLEVNTSHLQCSLHRIEMEIVVAYSPRLVVLKVVDDNGVRVNVGYVGEGLAALGWRRNIDNLETRRTSVWDKEKERNEDIRKQARQLQQLTTFTKKESFLIWLSGNA